MSRLRAQERDGDDAAVGADQHSDCQRQRIHAALAIDALAVGPVHADAAQHRQAGRFAQGALGQEGRADLGQGQRGAEPKILLPGRNIAERCTL